MVDFYRHIAEGEVVVSIFVGRLLLGPVRFAQGVPDTWLLTPASQRPSPAILLGRVHDHRPTDPRDQAGDSPSPVENKKSRTATTTTLCGGERGDHDQMVNLRGWVLR